MNEEKFKKYLGIANHDIQVANGTMELKSYVASILYEIDNLQSKIDKAIEVLNQHMPNYASCVKALDEIEFILKEDK